MSTVNQSSAGLMSLRAAMASVILTALVSFSSLVPESPDRIRWMGVFWLSVYASAMLAQAAWLGWRWLSSRRASSAHRSL
jgi:hypothetical protein